MRNRAAWLLAAALAASVAIELVFIRGHHGPGFHAVTGLGSCLVVVLVTKALGRALLQEPEEDEGA